jgi:hypothetical protein
MSVQNAVVGSLKTCFVALSVSCILILPAQAQQLPVPSLLVPPDKFDQFCYFNSGVYTKGAIFCVKHRESNRV